MFPELVRPATLSRALNMQLCIGNAIDVLQLLDAGITLEDGEFDVLSGAAELFRSYDSASTAPASSAISDTSGEVDSAVRAALAPSTMEDLHASLKSLADALAEIAATRGSNTVHVPIEDLLRKLSAIRHELAARATVTTDESPRNMPA